MSESRSVIINECASGFVRGAREAARSLGKTLVVPVALLVAPSAMAASFEIVDGETATTQQTLDNGETGVIEAGGSLDTGADTAIKAPGANVTITNDGSISAVGYAAEGIHSYGDYATITTSGNITTSGDSGRAVRSTGDYATITNSGAISTAGDSAHGLGSYGDYATIDNSGTISTLNNFAYGIRASGVDATISNSGSITTTGDFSYGIRSSGANPTIFNSGSISTAGNVTFGIYAAVADATIGNSGSITAAGNYSVGIYTDDPNATISNSGSISTGGDYSIGIYAYEANSTITNSGSISTTGPWAYGILSGSQYSTTSNSGSITGTGDSVHGIESYGDFSTVTNSGTINITGANGVGINVSGNDVTINNSGLISATGTNATAIRGSAGNESLNILSGSRIVGAIDLGGGSDTANIHGTPGSAVMTFANTETINVHAPNAVLTGGDTVVIVEPTGESSRGVVLAGLTSGVHNLLNWRMQTTQPLRPAQVAALELSPGMLHQERAPYAWGQLFGSKGSRDADGLMLGLDTRVSGAMGGYEQDYGNGRIGFMAGVARGSADTDATRQESDTFFAGVYGHAFLDWANLSASLIVGTESWDQNRLVLDNVNGYETARSNTDSLFISPSLSLSQAYTLTPTNELRPSATVSYSRGRYDGYSETGTTNANMTVGGRTVQALSGRIQGELVHAVDAGEVSLRMGLQARRTDSEAIKMSVGGDSLRFDAMGDKSAKGAYIGAGANLNIGKRLNLLAGLEVGRMSGGEKQLSGQLTLQYPF